MNVAAYFKRVTDQHPDLLLPIPAENEPWPMYHYVHNSANGELGRINEHLAALLHVRYVASTEELGLVDARLNASRHNALDSGVIWIREENLGTPLVKRIGVTYHPALCSKEVSLMEPQEWQQLLLRVFPVSQLEYGDAARTVTFTCAADRPDDTQLSPEMRRAVLRLERGIESGSPQHSPISAEALSMITEDFQRGRHIIPFRYDQANKVLSVYMSNVNDYDTINFTQRATECELKIYHMEPDDEEAYWMLRGVAAFAASQEDDMLRDELLMS